MKHKAVDTQRQIFSFERWQGFLVSTQWPGVLETSEKRSTGKPHTLCADWQWCYTIFVCHISWSDSNMIQMKQCHQNAGISNLRISYVTPARMSRKTLTALEVSFHKALLDCAQEGEKSDSLQKPSGQTTFTSCLLLTRKPAWIRVGMRRNVRISKENKKLYVLLPYNSCAHW